MSNPIIPSIPITQLENLPAANLAPQDLVAIVDVSDLSQGATGTTKKSPIGEYVDNSVNALANALSASTGSDQVGFVQVGANAVPRTALAKMRDEFVTPLDFGGVGDGITDDTSAILAMCASGANRFDFLNKSWKVTTANNAALVTFTGQTGIRIRGAGGEIYDPRQYTGDPIAPIFDFVGCQNCEVIGLNYRGAPLANPSTQLGYLGGTFVRWRNGSDNIVVDAQITNARYGFLSGAYTDTTQGNSKNITLRLKTSFCGYPIAVYWVSNLHATLYAEDVHRAAYLAGVDGGSIYAQWRNQYIADFVILLTDALTGVGTQVGCRDMTVDSYDLGSTVFQPSTACCGIANSRVGPVTIHENLRFNFRVKSTDTISTKVGGFKVASGPLPGGEPFYWEPTTILRNISVSGVIDRTGQTLESNSAGDIYWNSLDTGVHTATVQNIDFSGVTIIPSSGTTRDMYFVATGLVDRVTFDRVTSSGSVGLQMATNVTSSVIINDSSIPKIVQFGTIGPIYSKGSAIGVIPDAITGANYRTANSSTAGASAQFCTRQVVLPLTGPSVNWTSGIPAGAVVIGVTTRIQSTIAGATGYTIGVTGDLARYGSVTATAVGTTTNGASYAVTEVSPRLYLGSTTLIVSSKTADFSGGSLKIVLTYYSITPPTA